MTEQTEQTEEKMITNTLRIAVTVTRDFLTTEGERPASEGWGDIAKDIERTLQTPVFLTPYDMPRGIRYGDVSFEAIEWEGEETPESEVRRRW